MNLFVKTPAIVSQLIKKVLWKMPAPEKKLFLSFDDGPIPGNTLWILNTLAKYNAKATFFCVGHNVKKYPELYQKLGESGHTVGNHTFNHLNAWKTNNQDYLQNIDFASELINSNLFRPPYGKMNVSLYKEISKQYQIVMWDVLSRDFDAGISSEKCYNNVINHAKNGSIIVFHDNYKASTHMQYTLPKILDYFSKQGYSFDSINFKEFSAAEHKKLSA